MSDNTESTKNLDTPAKGLGAIVINLLRLVKTLRDQIAGLREALQVAVGMLAERDRQLDTAREANAFLREQVRQAASTDVRNRQDRRKAA